MYDVITAGAKLTHGKGYMHIHEHHKQQYSSTPGTNQLTKTKSLGGYYSSSLIIFYFVIFFTDTTKCARYFEETDHLFQVQFYRFPQTFNTCKFAMFKISL